MFNDYWWFWYLYLLYRLFLEWEFIFIYVKSRFIVICHFQRHMEGTVTRVTMYLDIANIWRAKPQMLQNIVKNIFAFIWMHSNSLWKEPVWFGRKRHGLQDALQRLVGSNFFFHGREMHDSAHRSISLGSFNLCMCGARYVKAFLKMEFSLCLRLWSWGKVQVESLADYVMLSRTVPWLSNRVYASVAVRN